MPRIPDHLRGIASLTQHEVTKVVSKYARMTRAELQAAVTDPHTSMLEVAIASIFAQAAKNGDYQRLSFLLDRAIGKAEGSREEEGSVNPIASLSEEELLQIVEQKKQKLLEIK